MVICLEWHADCFACGLTDASTTSKPCRVMPHHNPEWFYLAYPDNPGIEAIKMVLSYLTGHLSNCSVVCVPG